jgi:hypothetical protein
MEEFLQPALPSLFGKYADTHLSEALMDVMAGPTAVFRQ